MKLVNFWVVKITQKNQISMIFIRNTFDQNVFELYTVEL